LDFFSPKLDPPERVGGLLGYFVQRHREREKSIEILSVALLVAISLWGLAALIDRIAGSGGFMAA
jgi:hypothetical protein